MSESELNGTILYEDGPIASVTTAVHEEDDDTALIREVMEEPRTVMHMTVTVVLRASLDYVHIDVGHLEHPDGSSVTVLSNPDGPLPGPSPGVADATPGPPALKAHPGRTAGHMDDDDVPGDESMAELAVGGDAQKTDPVP